MKFTIDKSCLGMNWYNFFDTDIDTTFSQNYRVIQSNSLVMPINGNNPKKRGINSEICGSTGPALPLGQLGGRLGHKAKGGAKMTKKGV